MKKNALALPFVVGAFLLLAGCADDVTNTTVNETGISQLAAGENFPKCSKGNDGEMLYAADSGFIYVCTGKSWVSLGGESSVDTLVLSNVDTVVVRDTLLQKDSVFLSQNDTVVVKDTLVLKDSLISKDTLILSNVDTLVVRDTLLQKDSVFFSQIDTVVLSNVDTVFFKDTLIIRDTLLGLNGESCTAEELENKTGYKIICGTDSVGVVLNGTNGVNGAKGDDGAAGANGVGCTLADSGNGVVYVQCENDTVALYKALCGSTPYDPENISSGLFCQNGAFHFTDSRDNQTYRVTTIGSQTWMAENLNYRYTQGTATLDSSSFCYDNSADSCAKYGRLYLWSAAMDSAAVFSANGSGCGFGKTCSAAEPVRGVCPAGWHLPSLDELEALTSAVGTSGSGGAKLKATSGWYSNGNGSDELGFSALPAGVYQIGFFSGVGSYANFWSSYTSTLMDANGLQLYAGNSGVNLNTFFKNVSLSVRCVKDAD